MGAGQSCGHLLWVLEDSWIPEDAREQSDLGGARWEAGERSVLEATCIFPGSERSAIGSGTSLKTHRLYPISDPLREKSMVARREEASWHLKILREGASLLFHPGNPVVLKMCLSMTWTLDSSSSN